MTNGFAPLIVGIGGTPRPGSTTECAVRISLVAAEAQGARTMLFGGAFLAKLPLCIPGSHGRTAEEQALVDAVSQCAGIAA